MHVVINQGKYWLSFDSNSYDKNHLFEWCPFLGNFSYEFPLHFSCEFAKAKCSDGSLSIQSISLCNQHTTTSRPTTLDANQQLFCDNKDFISCPSTTKHVCASDGVVYNNE